MMNLTLAAAWPPMLASFLASLVEFVEALTVVLAIGTVRGWRSALAGSALALLVLLVLVLVLGAALTRIPLDLVQFFVGALLLLFGLRWLRKAILRAAGTIPLHDETAEFAEETRIFGAQARAAGAWDRIALAGAFKIVMLEGVEVVFIVIAIGAAGHMLVPAGIGALAALLIVLLLGVAIHRPLARVPENTLKFIVGILLSAFGTFWAGEGNGIAWPEADLALVALILLYALVALACVPLAKTAVSR